MARTLRAGQCQVTPDLLRDKLKFNFGNSFTLFVDVLCSALFFFCDLCCLNQELCCVRTLTVMARRCRDSRIDRAFAESGHERKEFRKQRNCIVLHLCLEVNRVMHGQGAK